MKDVNYWRDVLEMQDGMGWRKGEKAVLGEHRAALLEALRTVVALHEWVERLDSMPSGGGPVHRYARDVLCKCIAGELPEKEGE